MAHYLLKLAWLMIVSNYMLTACYDKLFYETHCTTPIASVNRGAAISTASTSFVLLFSILLYIFMMRPVNETWQGKTTQHITHMQELYASYGYHVCRYIMYVAVVLCLQ